MKSVKVIYVHGPAGCGKTYNAERLRQALLADFVVEEYLSPSQVAKNGPGIYLVLGNRPKTPGLNPVATYTFEEAMFLVKAKDL